MWTPAAWGDSGGDKALPWHQPRPASSARETPALGSPSWRVGPRMHQGNVLTEARGQVGGDPRTSSWFAWWGTPRGVSELKQAGEAGWGPHVHRGCARPAGHRSKRGRLPSLLPGHRRAHSSPQGSWTECPEAQRPQRSPLGGPQEAAGTPNSFHKQVGGVLCAHARGL